MMMTIRLQTKSSDLGAQVESGLVPDQQTFVSRCRYPGSLWQLFHLTTSWRHISSEQSPQLVPVNKGLAHGVDCDR
jgi:hypothetical protein